MEHTKTYKILDIGKATINDRIYPKEVIQKALDSDIIKEQLAFGGIPVIKKTKDNINLLVNGTVPIDNLIGLARRFDLTDDALSADILIVTDDYPENAYPYATGNTSLKDGVCYVTSYELLCLYVDGDE